MKRFILSSIGFVCLAGAAFAGRSGYLVPMNAVVPADAPVLPAAQFPAAMTALFANDTSDPIDLSNRGLTHLSGAVLYRFVNMSFGGIPLYLSGNSLPAADLDDFLDLDESIPVQLDWRGSSLPSGGIAASNLWTLIANAGSCVFQFTVHGQDVSLDQPNSLFDLSGNALTVSEVDALLATINAKNPGAATLDISGGTNAIPTRATTNDSPRTIAGAGTATVNLADYRRISDFNSRPRYQSRSNADLYILWTGAQWRILDGTSGHIFYFSTDNVATPDLVTTWQLGAFGSNPLPTVTAPPSNADEQAMISNGWTINTN